MNILFNAKKSRPTQFYSRRRS